MLVYGLGPGQLGPVSNPGDGGTCIHSASLMPVSDTHCIPGCCWGIRETKLSTHQLHASTVHLMGLGGSAWGCAWGGAIVPWPAVHWRGLVSGQLLLCANTVLLVSYVA